MRNYFLVVLLLLQLKLLSQNAVTNSGNLQIHTSGSFSVFGEFTNEATASLQNNGSIYAKASVTNHQTSMNQGTGSLLLDGSSLQEIKGSQPLKVYHLTTNNSAGFLLNNNLHVYGAHNFSSGIVSTSVTPNYLVYESGSSYSGTSDTKHVLGWVKKIGNSNFIFPTGNGSFLREIEIQNLSGVSEFNARYAGVTGNIYNLQSPIVSVNAFENWTLNRISGGTAQVKLNWDNSKVSFPEYVLSDVRAAYYSGTAWTTAGGTATGNVATSGTITSNLTSNFGSFVIASTSFPVPLKFLGIGAQREHSTAKITWQTVNEAGVSYYEIQRSTNGSSFTTVAIAAAKNLDFQSYSVFDLNVPSSRLLYRIKANDLDGSIRYSTIAILAAIRQDARIELLLNPVRSFILLATHDISASIYHYEIINAAGQVLNNGYLKLERSSTVSIPVNLTPGIYTLVIYNSIGRNSFKLVAQ